MFKRQNEIVKQLSDKQIVQNLYVTQLLLLSISCILSFFLFDSLKDFLGIWKIYSKDFIGYGTGLAAIVIGLDLILIKYAPPDLIDDGGINEKIFSKRTIPHIVVLTALIAFSEELLFRGVLQTHFGIWFASFIFAILHFRYVTKWLLFIMVVSISFLLGVVYEWTDTLYTTILAHFLIDLIFAVLIRLQFVKGVKKRNEGI